MENNEDLQQQTPAETTPPETIETPQENEFERVAEIPETGNEKGFFDFLNIPTLQDGKESTNEATIETPQVPEKTQNNGVNNSGGTIERQTIDKGAKYVVLFVDMLMGALTDYLGKLDDAEIEARMFRTKENEKRDLINLMSEIFIEENWKISPNIILIAAAVSSFGANVYGAAKYGRAKKNGNKKPTQEITTPKRSHSKKIGRPKKVK